MSYLYPIYILIITMYVSVLFTYLLGYGLSYSINRVYRVRGERFAKKPVENNLSVTH